MISRRHLIWLSVLVAADVLLSAFSVWTLPVRIPLHWNFQGQIDRYGSPVNAVTIDCGSPWKELAA